MRLKLTEITEREGRYRKDLGDIKSLANSMASLGLLQPIVVDTTWSLVAGARRLAAARLLGWSDITVSVVDLNQDGQLQAENDENEQRKAFTPSEQVAIFQAIKERIGDRQGQLVVKCPQVEPGTKTREAAAQAAGFTSDRTARQAEKVVEQGVPEVVEAMDKGIISINDAAEVVDHPPEAQREAVEKVQQGESRTATGAIDSKKRVKEKTLSAMGTLVRLIEQLGALGRRTRFGPVKEVLEEIKSVLRTV